MKDMELEPKTEAPPSSLERSSKAPWIVALLLLVAAGAGYWYWRGLQPAVVAPVPQAAVPVAAPKDDALSALPADHGDSVLAEWAGKIFAIPDARWTEGGDLARRVVGFISAVANGDDPRPFLRTFAPAQAFAVEKRGAKTVISTRSEARFDAIAASIASARPEVVAEAYKAVHPLLGAAWHEIAPPQSQLDDALDRALAKMLAVQVPDGGTEVVAKGAVWKLADPSLEALSPAQKALIRMGPANAKRIQAQLRLIGQALALPSAK